MEGGVVSEPTRKQGAILFPPDLTQAASLPKVTLHQGDVPALAKQGWVHRSGGQSSGGTHFPSSREERGGAEKVRPSSHRCRAWS